jgi:hemolysin D
VVSERTKVIQPLERSVVKRVLVKDGDRVKAGQALVELDPTSATADKTTVDDQLKASQSEVLRARALLQALEHGACVARSCKPAWARSLIPGEWTEPRRAPHRRS